MGVRSFKNYTLKLTNSQTMLTAYVIVLMHINRAIFRFAVSSVLLLPDGTRCKGDLKSLFDVRITWSRDYLITELSSSMGE